MAQVNDILLLAMIAALGVLSVGAIFIWRPWVRRGPRLPHHHPAE